MCSYLQLMTIFKKNCGLTPRINGSKMVAPPDGVHRGSSDSTWRARYLLTHFDRVEALISIFLSRDKCLRVVQV